MIKEFLENAKYNKEYTYKPLPDNIEVRNSKIHGQGLFTSIEIPERIVLGITHVVTDIPIFSEQLIRTPLGGFLNHSRKANCKLEEYWVNQQKIYVLITLGPILKNEELTVDYRVRMPDTTFDFDEHTEKTS